MKFTNGYWLVREGVTPHFATQALDAEVREIDHAGAVTGGAVSAGTQAGAAGSAGRELSVYAAVKPTKTRGDTLNATLLTLRYSSPAEGVIRVRVSHFEGAAKKGPAFEITEEAGFAPEIELGPMADPGIGLGAAPSFARIRSGGLEAKVNMNEPWLVEWTGDGKHLTSNQSKSTGYMLLDGASGGEALTGRGAPYMKEEFSLGVGETVYGLGERFTPFVKNGQTVDIWNADGGTASEQTYKNIPFYLTNRGYGIFVNDPGKVSYEVASEKVSRVQFSVPGETLEYFVIYGPEPKKILERYTALTGRPALPPDWSWGLWLTTSFTTSYDENTVMGFIDGMLDRGIPLKVFHFDCFWMKGFHWSDFRWDSQTFPDPAGLIKRIKAKGVKVCVWINPYIAQRAPLFEEGKEKGYLLRKTDGSVWQTDLWQAGMGIVDFSNPEACAWYAEKLEALLDIGVDAFKTDFGERIPCEGVAWHDGGDPDKWHNYYTQAYNRTVFELLERKLGKGNACLFARSATAGGQKFPVHWGGDCESTFESMAESLRGGLSLGLSGFGFWSHDIGGFEGTPRADLFKRWLAFGLLSSHSRLHGSNSYRVPWNIDEESVEVTRRFTALKNRIMPYLLKCGREAHEKGTPVMRAMLLEFPGDPTCAFLDRQYMLGPDILVAPVLSADGSVEYWLPAGDWVHLIDGRTETGGKWISETYDFMSLAVWKKNGAKVE